MSTRNQPSLLCLPREIREIVYVLALPVVEEPNAVSNQNNDCTVSIAAASNSISDEQPMLKIDLVRGEVADHFPPLCTVSKQLLEEATSHVVRRLTLVLNDSPSDIIALTRYLDIVPINAAFNAIRHVHLRGGVNTDFKFLARCLQLESLTLDLRETNCCVLAQINVGDIDVRRDCNETMDDFDIKGLFECRSLKEVRLLYEPVRFREWGEREDMKKGRPVRRISWGKYISSNVVEWMQKKFTGRGLQTRVFYRTGGVCWYYDFQTWITMKRRTQCDFYYQTFHLCTSNTTAWGGPSRFVFSNAISLTGRENVGWRPPYTAIWTAKEDTEYFYS
ncbi:hypothetical protein BU16DRAFT_535491 [Lophium mytilinum]|uniref:F-box domain-containing protein n=1 Tax=Lophium mytilinum TaxID=390894 RepID=A0A6A6R421_9PEZI|nr:hypothetical protein BU16DRAFT_535491 [Lophium mytilinum]